MYILHNRGLCPCATDPDFVYELKGVQMEFTRLLEELVQSGKYDTRDDFTVVFQPHLRDLTPPLDVRHFEIGHPDEDEIICNCHISAGER